MIAYLEVLMMSCLIQGVIISALFMVDHNSRRATK